MRRRLYNRLQKRSRRRDPGWISHHAYLHGVRDALDAALQERTAWQTHTSNSPASSRKETR